MGKKLGALVLMVALAGGAYWFLKNPTGQVEAGRPAPEFRLKDSRGAVHALSAWKGQPVVVHFWASWCAPCVDEIPNWLEAARSYASKNAPTSVVKWVAISLDENWADAHKILKEANLPANGVSLIDVDKKVPDAFGSFQFPESYLLDSSHRIARKWVGSQDWQGEAVKAALTEVSHVTEVTHD